MSHSVSIAVYRPEWLAEGGRYRFQMGVSFTCPSHGEPCRIECWFINPCDLEAPAPGKKPYYLRTGYMLVELTLEPAISIPGHWTGWLTEGRLYTAPAN